jgi:Flp pilus assembly protein TadG
LCCTAIKWLEKYEIAKRYTTQSGWSNAVSRGMSQVHAGKVGGYMHEYRERRIAGSASIEFAGAMIVLALVLVMVFQAGAMMVTQVAATNAAREGARAAVTLPPADPHAAVQRAASGYEQRVSVHGGGDSVTVQVELKVPVIFRVVSDWNWWVQSSATMRRER